MLQTDLYAKAITHSNPIRILHVDDDVSLLNVAKQCLELQIDIEVESVCSVNQALKLLKSNKYDVIVSDYQMAQKDGLEFLYEIKARGITTPFILFTGKAREEIVVKALNLGAFRYVNKLGDPDAAYAELASCIRQATDLSKTQCMLKESEKRFKAVFDTSIDAILVLTDTGEIVYVNKSAETILDYAKEEITKALIEHFSKQFTATYEQNMLAGFRQLSDENVIMTGKTVELELKKASGDKATVELSFSAFIENGLWFGVSIIRDITERKKQEQLLEESQQTLKALFSNNPGAIVFTDKNFKITDVNPSFVQLFGFSLEKIKGQQIAEAIVPTGLKDESELFQELLTKGPISFTTERKKADGSTINVSISGGPLQVKGEIIGFFMVYTDISDIVVVQNELERALAKAKLLNEKIAVLGGFTRHDVRNKLGLINGNLYLARKKCKISPDIEKFLHSIDEVIKNVTDILDFARAYEMIGAEETVATDVGVMFQKAISLFSDYKGIQFKNRCKGLKVVADSLIVQVFHNLIDNSLKYGEKATTITLYTKKSCGSKTLKLIYKDNGVGVDERYKPHLFQRGFGKGTGFGLYLIRKICEVYGWTVEEKGKPGEGVKFEFDIPLEKVKQSIQ